MNKPIALTTAILGIFAYAEISSAAILTIDVRAVSVVSGGITTAVSDAKSLTLDTGSSVVNFNVYAQIPNGDGSHSNDSVTSVSTALISTEGATPLLGNIASVARNASFGSGSDGTAKNLDANADLEWGLIGGSSLTGNFNPASVTPVSSSQGSGITEVLLGTFTWTAPASLTPNATTKINSAPWVASSGVNRNKAAYTFVSDGTQDSNGTNIAAGSDVTITTASQGASAVRQTLTLVPTSGSGNYVPTFASVDASTTGFTVGGLVPADASALVKIVLAYSGTTLTAGDFANESSFATYTSLAEMLADNPWVKSDTGAGSFSTLTSTKFVLLTAQASSQVATLDFTNNTVPAGVSPIRIAAIPEPATLLTTGLISVGLLSARRRKSA